MGNLNLGKLLMVAGVMLIAAGALLHFLGRVPGGFLPGDIVIERKNFGFYFPVVTCLLVSIVLTLLLNLFGRR